ncbi:MAG: flippase [Bacteroidetes bacterium]|nr:flippase [Bacteroidota bacterium]
MIKNFFYTILLSVTNILFPLISFPYASRILGPVGIGKMQFVVSFSQYFALFAALGIPIYGITQAAKYRQDAKKLANLFGALTTIFFITSCIVSVIYLLVVLCVPYFAADRHLYLAAGSLILLGFCYTDWYYSGIEQFKVIALRSVLVKSICLGLLYFFIRTEADYGKYLLIVLFSILGNHVIGLVTIAARTRFSFRELQLREHIQPLLYIFSSTVAASIYTTLDTVMLGFLANNRSVGLYTASIKLTKLVIPFVTAMGVILIPSISKGFARNDLEEVKKSLDNSFYFLVFIAIPAGAGLCLLAPELIHIFSGDRFTDATLSMQILAWLPLIIGFGHFFAFQILVPAGKNKEMLLAMLAGVVVFFVLNFLLVPSLQETGAAITTVATEIVVSVSYFYCIKKYYSFTYHWKFLFESAFAVLFFFPAVVLIRHISAEPLMIVPASVIICAVIYTAIHLLLFRNHFLFNFIKPFQAKYRSAFRAKPMKNE